MARVKEKTPDAMWGWHFLQKSRKLGFMNKRPVKLGDRMEMQYRSPMSDRIIKERLEPRLCRRGMHASEKILDALHFVSPRRGVVLCRVLVEEGIETDSEKFVGRFRTVKAWATFDDIAKKVLFDFIEKRNKKVAALVAEWFKTGKRPNCAGRGIQAGPTWNLADDLMRGDADVGGLLRDLEFWSPNERRVPITWLEARTIHHAREAGLLVEGEGA